VAFEASAVDLSSTRLGIVGKLDVVRGAGTVAVPVDFKRGKKPHVDGGVYPPERIQAILQALLLRDNGFKCDEARIYFADSKSTISIVIDEIAEAEALAAISAAKALTARTTLPPPLIDSPKCARCSLNSICLPDETNQLHAASSDVRKFAAPMDDSRPLYVVTPGSRVGLSGEVLQIKLNDIVTAESRLMDTANISLFGNVQISSQACRAVLDRDIPVFYLSYGGWLYGYARSIEDHSLDLRVAQHRLTDDLRLRISRSIVEGKVRNQRTIGGKRSKRVLQALAICIVRVSKASALDELLGLEGRAARIYFETFATLISNMSFDFRKRTRRPPSDPVNAMLSFGYAMLTKETVAAAVAVGFEPSLGVFHAIRPGRPSLALDLMEEFRPLIVDSTVLSMLNTGEIRRSHFIERGIGVNLTDEGRKIFIRAMERRLNSTIIHPTFAYEASYRRSLWIQARLLARTIQGDIDTYPAFVTR
jgi:CRISPR-associated protein Cas1